MDLAHLDAQLEPLKHDSDRPQLADSTWSQLATTIHREVGGLDEETVNRLRVEMLISPERYLDEMTAFQAWMEIAHENSANPAIVRAQVMTELYVAFVWLRDALLRPLADAMPEAAAVTEVARFLGGGPRRMLRNAIAHGRWCYLDDFSGLECWAEPSRGQTHERFVVGQELLDHWQRLSRGATIAALLGLASPPNP